MLLLLSILCEGATSLGDFPYKIAKGRIIFYVNFNYIPMCLKLVFHWSIAVMKNPNESVLKVNDSLISILWIMGTFACEKQTRQFFDKFLLYFILIMYREFNLSSDFSLQKAPQKLIKNVEISIKLVLLCLLDRCILDCIFDLLWEQIRLYSPIFTQLHNDIFNEGFVCA